MFEKKPPPPEAEALAFTEALYDMSLGDKLKVDREQTYLRVPGGWILRTTVYESTTIRIGPQNKVLCSSCAFIPWEIAYRKLPKKG